MKLRVHLLLIWALLLVVLSWNVIGEELLEEEEEESEDPASQYFYLHDPEAPIVEYQAVKEEDDTKPDFIYEPNRVTGWRLVEFYAHW